MSNKRKLIRLEQSENLKGVYETPPHGFAFAFVGKKERKEGELRIKPVNSPFVNCRNNFCNMPIVEVNKDPGSVGWKYDPEVNGIDMSKLRVVFSISTKSFKTTKKKVFSGKRVLNLLEEEAGWQKSIISSVIHTEYKDTKMYLLTGPEQWMRSSSMLSLVVLIMRIASLTGGPFESNTLKELEKEFNVMTREQINGDLSYLKNIKDYIIPIVRNFDRIFTKGPEAYYAKPGQPNPGSGGINAFVNLQPKNEAVHNFKKLISKEN